MNYWVIAFVLALVVVSVMISYASRQNTSIEPFRGTHDRKLMFNGSYHHDPVMCLAAGNKPIPCTAFSTA